MFVKTLILTIVLAFCLLVQNSYAASSDNDGFVVGLYVGGTYNHLYSSTGYRSFTEYKNGYGYVIGVPVGYNVKDWLSVFLEPSVIAKSYSLVRTGIFVGNKQSWRNTYLQFPAMAQFSFGGKLRGFVNLGGYMGWWFGSRTWGKYRESTSNIDDIRRDYFHEFDERVEFNKERDNRFDGGLLAGLGLKYDLTQWTFFVEARYSYSLCDMQKNYMYEQIPRYNDTYIFTFGVTCKLGRFVKR
jgi:hypothetical protein